MAHDGCRSRLGAELGRGARVAGVASASRVGQVGGQPELGLQLPAGSGEESLQGGGTVPAVWSRVVALLSARFGGRGETSNLPVGPLLMLAGISALFGDVAREILPTFAYGLFVLSVAVAMVAIPLLGEVGAMLRSDEAADWIEAQPVSPLELRLARTLHALLVVTLLSVAALLPAVLLAPGVGLGGAACLLIAGVALAFVASAILLGIQAVLGGRAEGLLIALQTALIAAVLVGGLAGLRLLPELAVYDSFSSARGTALALYPPSWFAAAALGETLPLAAAAATTLAALTGLVLLPQPGPAAADGGARVQLLERALAPVHALALRFWVAREERGVFDLVYRALPREREFKLRTYPLLGLPLAFYFGARAEEGAMRELLLALISLLPAVYLPVMITQVPGSASHAARWLIDSAPVTGPSIENAAIKALAVRFLLPAFVLLGALTAWAGGPALIARFVVPGYLVALWVLRALYVKWVEDPPLSVAPEDVVTRVKWSEVMLTLAMIAVALAAALAIVVDTPARTAVLIAGLAALELAADRAQRQRAANASVSSGI